MAVNVRNIGLLKISRLNKGTGSRELTTTLTETQGQQQEQDQPAPLPPVSPHQASSQEELDTAVSQSVDGLIGM
jgi:hypothetical protein